MIEFMAKNFMKTKIEFDFVLQTNLILLIIVTSINPAMMLIIIAIKAIE